MRPFTYNEASLNKGKLFQGDLLSKTEDISRLLQEVHPHYVRDDYKYFMVLTQSCDLDRRDGEDCKARYISIAAVRSLDTALIREAEKVQSEDLQKRSGFIIGNEWNQIRNFVEKLLNNNHPDFFFLHSDDENIFEHHCVFLRLSIAIRSKEHFQKCLDAKFMELSDAFRDKLGWLIGNMYSRVGTKDWFDFIAKAEFNKKIDEILKHKFIKIEKKDYRTLIDHLSKCGINPNDLTRDQLVTMITRINGPRVNEEKQKVLEGIRSIIQSAIKPDVDVNNVLKKIEIDQLFSARFR